MESDERVLEIGEADVQKIMHDAAEQTLEKNIESVVTPDMVIKAIEESDGQTTNKIAAEAQRQILLDAQARLPIKLPGNRKMRRKLIKAAKLRNANLYKMSMVEADAYTERVMSNIISDDRYTKPGKYDPVPEVLAELVSAAEVPAELVSAAESGKKLATFAPEV